MFLNSHSLSYLFTGLRAGAVILAAREAHDLSALTRYMHTRGAGCPPLRDGREMGERWEGREWDRSRKQEIILGSFHYQEKRFVLLFSDL